MKHRNSIYSLISLCLLSSISPLLAASSGKSEQQPNIVFIITDDQGMGDLGCTGNPYVKTPNIDKFHEQAIRLTNYHVSTTCAPSRASIMTGRHCNRVNVYHTINGRSILFEDEVTLPQILADNGYTNAMYGKWHLGDNYPYRPQDRGFHEVVMHGAGGIGQAPDYWRNDYFDDNYFHNGEPEQYEGYCTDVFFDEALDFIESNKDKPFFCYISTNAPHGPYNVPLDYLSLYDGPEFEKLNSRLLRFYAMITNIDDNFKRLQDKLDALGLTDNTILIFTTDNGTSAGRSTYNAGLKGSKGSQYDGGHRVPLFIQWPNGELTGGKDIDQLVAHYDLLPTFVDLLGLDFTPQKPLDGTSLKPLLTEANPEWENRILYMDTQREQNLIKYKAYTVMDQNWRLVDGDKLYYMPEDRGQETNVISEHPEIAARLAAGYETWWQSFLDDGVTERYAYFKIGAPEENPVKLCSHDHIVGRYTNAWHQSGVIEPTPSTGKWKVEFVEDGEYTFALRRFPRESGLPINATFAAEEDRPEIDRGLPASVKDDFTKAYLYVADKTKEIEIKAGDEEVTFKAKIPAGKYDLEAHLVDSVGRIYPAHYAYIEKL